MDMVQMVTWNSGDMQVTFVTKNSGGDMYERVREEE